MKLMYLKAQPYPKRLLRWKLIRFFNSGITTTEDTSKRNDIRIMNLLCAISFCSPFLMALLFWAVQFYLQALACLVNAFFFIIPFRLNAKGRNLQCKIIITIFTNCTLLIWCCIFSHNSVLNTYFLFMAIVCIYLHRTDEGKWSFFSVAFSLTCFILESTGLRQMLPALNLVDKDHDLQIANFILLTGLIIFLVIEIGSFVFISEERERKLFNTKQQLINSRKKLSAQNRDLKAFGAAASHFIQTPVYVSRLFVEKLKNETGAGIQNEKLQQYFEIIETSLEQMEDFIKGLFSQYQMMEIATKPEGMDVLAELIKIREVLLQKNPDAIILLPEQPIALKANRLLLIIIFQSVMENALKYNAAKVPRLEVKFMRAQGINTFLFSDNGIGIEPSYRKKIFDPFVRVDHHHYVGTGLGLTGAKRAAEVMSGDLFCETTGPEGSTFRLNIKYSED